MSDAYHPLTGQLFKIKAFANRIWFMRMITDNRCSEFAYLQDDGSVYVAVHPIGSRRVKDGAVQLNPPAPCLELTDSEKFELQLLLLEVC